MIEPYTDLSLINTLSIDNVSIAESSIGLLHVTQVNDIGNSGQLKIQISDLEISDNIFQGQ